MSIAANGGGSGTGIAALQKMTFKICTASRQIKPTEREALKSLTGEYPKKIIASPTIALAICVNPRNSLTEISIPELTEIWAEGGRITTWEQINPTQKGQLILLGRQNNSGTYDFFREHVCGKTAEGKQRDFRAVISELNGPADVVAQVARTRLAMGYCAGLAEKHESVKLLKLSPLQGAPAVEPRR